MAPPTETFDDGDDDGGGFDPSIEETIVTRRRGRPAGEVPDDPVENAEDTPLLVHAGTGKANTVTYLKVVRMDGGPGERGYKGRLPSESTIEDVARRYGNGTYTIQGCSAKHKVLATETELEISMPQYEDSGPVAAAPNPMGSASGTLHGMKLMSEHSREHATVVRDMATHNAEQTTAIAKATVESVTAFAEASRTADRASHEASLLNMQTFFGAMAQQSAAAHAQQMEMLTAMHDRARAGESDPMQMVEILVKGMALGRENGGEDVEPWVHALREGTASLGHIATLASAGGGMAPRQLPAPQFAPQTAGPSPVVANPQPAQPAQATAQPPANPTRRRRLPFTRAEAGEFAKLKETLRKRGIDVTTALTEYREHFETVPDSEIYESGGDGPTAGSDDAHPDDTPQHETSKEASTADAPGEGREGEPSST